MRALVSISTYIVEWWIAFLYFSNMFERKKGKLLTALIGMIAYCFPMLLYIFFYNSFLNTALFFATNLLCSFFLFKSTLSKSAITSALFTALMICSEFIVIALLSSASGEKIDYYLNSLPMYILTIVMSKTLLLLLSMFLARVVSSATQSSVERAPSFLFIFPLSAIFIDFSFWSMAAETNPSPQMYIMITVGSLVLLISVLLTYIFYGHAMRRSQELFRLQNEYERVQVDKEYYDILDHQNEELRTFIHDEKSHLSALQTMSSTEEIHAYVENILGELRYASPVGNTKNKMLDLIIGKYVSLCKIKNIYFAYTTITANLSFLDDTDLVSLLSNILDNALEAAETAENGWIGLALDSQVAGVTVLSCRNNSGRIPIVQNGKLKTTKCHEKQHGIGIKSIIRTAKKYDGSYEWCWDDSEKVFTTRIIFER